MSVFLLRLEYYLFKSKSKVIFKVLLVSILVLAVSAYGQVPVTANGDNRVIELDYTKETGKLTTMFKQCVVPAVLMRA